MLGYRLTSSALETRLSKGRLSRNQKRTYLQWSLQIDDPHLRKTSQGSAGVG